MLEDLVTLSVEFFSWSADDVVDDYADWAAIEELLQKSSNVPDALSIEKQVPKPRTPKYKVVLSEETLEDFLQERLTPEDYQAIGRAHGDLEGLSRAELWELAYPFERGGGSGPSIDYLVQLLTPDATTIVAAIAGLTAITKEVVQRYFSRHDQRTIRLRRGENEIELTGYSPQEADRLIDDFFTKITRELLSK